MTRETKKAFGGGAGKQVKREAASEGGEAERRYLNLIEGSIQGILVHREFRPLFANQALADILGYDSPEEFVADGRVESLIAPVDRARAWSYAEARLAGKDAPRDYELRAFRKDGSPIWLNVRAAVVDWDGAPAIQASLFDITDRKRTEEALREAETRAAEAHGRLLDAIENMSDGFALFDRDDRLVLTNSQIAEHNPAAADVLKPGTPFEDIIRHFAEAGRYPDAVGRVEAWVEERMARHRHPGEPFERRIQGGRWQRVTEQRTREGGTVLLRTDITELKERERALGESERRLRRAMLEAPIPVMIHAEGGEVLLISNKWTELSGYSRADIPTIFDWTEKAYGAGKDHMRALIGGLYEIAEPFEDEAHVTTAAGEKRIWEFRTNPLGLLADGRRFVISMAIDVTERRQAEAQLRQAQKMDAIGRLAGGIAHDLNNVLQIITGFTQLSLESPDDTESAASNLERVLTAAARAKNLTRQILTFSGDGKSEKTTVDLEVVLRETMRLLRSTLPATVEIEQKLSCPSAILSADPAQIEQVVVNLCVNAAHAMRARAGKLSVALERTTLDKPTRAHVTMLEPGDYLKIVVADGGEGMDAETQARMFEPFFTTKGKSEGSGLGLAVTYGIIREHGGAIVVDSAPGKGTRIELYFPDRHETVGDAARENQGKEAGAEGGRERLLFVDDERDLIRLAETALAKHGYRVAAATSGAEALEIFRRDPAAFDLVVCDYTMAGMTGEALIRELTAIRPDVPVILCTGFSDDLDEAAALAIGVEAFLRKPLAVADLLRAVRRVFDR